MNQVAHKVLHFDRFVLDLTRGCLRAGAREITTGHRASSYWQSIRMALSSTISLSHPTISNSAFDWTSGPVLVFARAVDVPEAPARLSAGYEAPIGLRARRAESGLPSASSELCARLPPAAAARKAACSRGNS